MAILDNLIKGQLIWPNQLGDIKDGSVKLIFLLVCYLVLPYNSIKPNFYDSLERRYCVSKYKYNF